MSIDNMDNNNNNNDHDDAEVLFSEPIKHINDDSSNINNKIKFFQMTKGYKRIIKYSTKFNKMMMQQELLHDSDTQLIHIFDIYLFSKLNNIIAKYPPLPKEQFAQRFGNIAVRSIHDELAVVYKDILYELLENLLNYRLETNPNKEYKHDIIFLNRSVVEISHYFLNSFGNRDRMDFGTGHELSFVAFLAIFDILDLIEYNTYILKKFFQKYFFLVKALIIDYKLEPAGSHGVWGLDDNFHFSYLIGSAQMINKPLCKPSCSLNYARDNVDKVNECDFNFLIWNLQVIGEVKNYKNFKEHSPMLNDILNSVNDWRRINNGLYKMWVDEVLLKFPVVQHFKFGSYFFPWKLTKKSKKEIKEIRKQNTSKDKEKSDLLKYRMNQITVDSVIDRNEAMSQTHNDPSHNKRLFPMNPPKRKFHSNK